MTNPEPRAFSFREIAALDDAAAALGNWISKSSSFFSEFWTDITGYSAQLSLGNVNTDAYGKLLESVSKESFYCTTKIDDSLQTIWHAKPQEFSDIAGEMLCRAAPDEEEEEQPPVTELSAIELKLISLLIDNLTASFTSGWLGDQPLQLVVSELDKDPRKTQLCRQRDLMTSVEILFELQSKKATINWLIPKQELSELLRTVLDQRSQEKPKQMTTETATRLPIEVVAVLGEAAVPMTALSDLQPGQLITLDQRIDRPLMAYVNGQPYYQCWPGKVGAAQSIEISKCLHDDPGSGGT